jgi:hypothetical protein
VCASQKEKENMPNNDRLRIVSKGTAETTELWVGGKKLHLVSGVTIDIPLEGPATATVKFICPIVEAEEIEVTTAPHQHADKN